jgi:NAD(P)-dependent dehydrogenase (short-subunit alcohol dehydrogenase family)
VSVDLEEKTCVVTGAARSIGLGVAEMYAGLGAKVALIDIDEEVVRQAERIAAAGRVAAGPAVGPAAGHAVKGYLVDITGRDAVMSCFGDIARSLGPVFALVNVAGAVDQQPFEEITPDRLARINRINIDGTVWCAQAALATMRTLGDGRIINFSSKSGKTGSAIMGAYSAAKGAVISLTQAMAYELAKDNIKVNCLCPGIVEGTGVWSSVSRGYVKNLGMSEEAVVKQFTAKVPLGRLCRIEDVVAFVRFLTVDGDYCTGQAFNITGGREMH